MVNLILKFTENTKKPGQLVAFNRKKVHFITPDAVTKVVSGETWECFLWSEKDKFCLVKPYKKVDEANINAEMARVEQFNKELTLLTALLGDHFSKIVFDEDNKPFMLSKLSYKLTKEKHSDYIVLKKDEQVWARPLMTPEDRKFWQKNQ